MIATAGASAVDRQVVSVMSRMKCARTCLATEAAVPGRLTTICCSVGLWTAIIDLCQQQAASTTHAISITSADDFHAMPTLHYTHAQTPIHAICHRLAARQV